MSNSKAEEPLSFPLSSLPEELVLSCLARVLISNYPALSLVSKRYRSLVASPELYKARSLMGLTEKCFYVCLGTINSTPRLYNLHLEKTLDAKSRLIPIPSFTLNHRSSMVALDWGIYVIGGSVKGERTTDIWLLDCRTNTWHKVPSMAVARYSAAAGVVDGKIYVFGGCKDFGCENWGEVFDPKTQIWDSLPSLPHGIQTVPYEFQNFDESLVIEEKVYAVEVRWDTNQKHILYYSPNEGKWGRMNHDDSKPRLRKDCVMIDKLLYCCDYLGNLFWCEPEEFKWKEVKGLEYLRMCIPQTFSFEISYVVEVFISVCIPEPPSSKLRDFGSNIMVFWCVVEQYAQSSELRCAEILLERSEEGNEILGTFVWLDSITYDHNEDRLEVLYSGFVNL